MNWFRRAPLRERADSPGGMDEPPPQITLFGGIAQHRDPVGVFPQEPPEAIRQGVDTRARPAVMPIAILTGINPQAVAEGRFVAAIISPHPHATYPLTRLTPDARRANMKVPAHVAYGSLFVGN